MQPFLKDDNRVGEKGEKSPIPEWVLENWEVRTASSGIWIANNSDYKNEEEPYDAYAIHWEYGLGNKHLKGRLYCVNEEEDLGSIWQFTEYWDPLENKLRIIQIGSDGTVGEGEIWITDDGKIKELQLLVAPDGSKFKSGHLSWMHNGINHTQSYTVNGEEWTKNRFYKWELKKEKDFETPKEYERIAFLIGTWEILLGENKARMTFSWGENKRTIHYTNAYKPINKEWQQENEGLITYNGVKQSLVFLTSYSFVGHPLMAEGRFRFEDGNIFREFTCHYEEGDGLPWSEGDKAPSGGTSLEFKQIWTPIDETHFNGEFLWKKNGKWDHPIQSDTNIELWTKISN